MPEIRGSCDKKKKTDINCVLGRNMVAGGKKKFWVRVELQIATPSGVRQVEGSFREKKIGKKKKTTFAIALWGGRW